MVSGCLAAGQFLVLQLEYIFRLIVVRILDDTIHRANLYALRLFKMTHALGAKVGINLVDLFTLGNGVVGALGLTDIAVDAFIVD